MWMVQCVPQPAVPALTLWLHQVFCGEGAIGLSRQDYHFSRLFCLPGVQEEQWPLQKMVIKS